MSQDKNAKRRKEFVPDSCTDQGLLSLRKVDSLSRISLEILEQTSLDGPVNRGSFAFLAAFLTHLILFGLAGLVPRFVHPPTDPKNTVLVELETPRRPSDLQKKLLLQPESADRQQQAPQTARYFSGQNRQVTRESRSRNQGSADLSRFQSPSLREGLSAKSLKTNKPTQLENFRPERFSAGSEAQRLDDTSLAEGAENLLNTVESVHYSFYSRIYGSLAPLWQSYIRSIRPNRPLSPGDYRVVADLVLDSQGNLIGIEFHERSEVLQFNEAVIASVSKIKKFPNPPKDLISGRTEFRTLWSFTVNVNRNSFISLTPPQRID